MTANLSFSPFATMRKAMSGKGRCNSSAFGASDKSRRSIFAGVVRMTGMAFGWTGRGRRDADGGPVAKKGTGDPPLSRGMQIAETVPHRWRILSPN